MEVVAEARLGFPPDDLHIPSALNMLAEFYRNTRRPARAAELYQEVGPARRGVGGIGECWRDPAKRVCCHVRATQVRDNGPLPSS